MVHTYMHIIHPYTHTTYHAQRRGQNHLCIVPFNISAYYIHTYIQQENALIFGEVHDREILLLLRSSDENSFIAASTNNKYFVKNKRFQQLVVPNLTPSARLEATRTQQEIITVRHPLNLLTVDGWISPIS